MHLYIQVCVCVCVYVQYYYNIKILHVSFIFGSWLSRLGWFCDKVCPWSAVTAPVRLTSDTHSLEKTPKLQNVCCDSFDRFKSHYLWKSSNLTHNHSPTSSTNTTDWRKACMSSVWADRNYMITLSAEDSDTISERKLIVYDMWNLSTLWDRLVNRMSGHELMVRECHILETNSV